MFSAPLFIRTADELGDESEKNYCCVAPALTASPPSGFDFNLNTAGQVKLAQGVYGTR
jgi:hypothetical protein